MAVHTRVVELLEGAEVAARAERAAGARDHDRAYLGVLGRRVERARQRVAQRGVERVALLGAVERQRPDPLGGRFEQRPLVSA